MPKSDKVMHISAARMGKFNTRYDAQEHFGKLRDGSVQVKGGWRIYSSGPGIYMNQLISNALGIRRKQGNLVIDPVLPVELDGLEFEFTFMNRPIIFNYHLNETKQQVLINGTVVETEALANPYREGGFIVKQKDLENLLTSDNNVIDIYM